MIRKRFALFGLLALVCILLPGCREDRDEQVDAKPVIYLYPEAEQRSRSNWTTTAS